MKELLKKHWLKVAAVLIGAAAVISGAAEWQTVIGFLGTL